MGGDKTVPEFQGDGYDKASDPFATDVYYLGNRFREEFLKKFKGLEFADELVTAMVADDPQKRPTADEAAKRFAVIQRKLPWWKRRQRLVSRKEGPILRGFRGIGHIIRTTAYVLLRLPAVPTPPAS
ncbi:hypothetical protein EVJ58_g6553 [Rhodofomes roseus]|nr:hypothetical protein EVJ58_g6553 [Rhodofomes roseus]